jgi:hypothetical protein
MGLAHPDFHQCVCRVCRLIDYFEISFSIKQCAQASAEEQVSVCDYNVIYFFVPNQ